MTQVCPKSNDKCPDERQKRKHGRRRRKASEDRGIQVIRPCRRPADAGEARKDSALEPWG